MSDENEQKRSLLLIHGRDFKPAADAYLELSIAAIRAGLERDCPDCLSCFDQIPNDIAWYGDPVSYTHLRAHETF